MPITPTYPGIYIEEISSGVRPITGVSTSDTAFVDVFERGPTNVATRITSYSDFERTFGGLYAPSEASYGIQQFYLNGGQIAWVVRIGTPVMKEATASLLGSSPPQEVLQVVANSLGAWGNNLQVAVDWEGVPSNSLLFNLTIQEVNPINQQVVLREVYRGVTLDKTHPRYVVDVVKATSTLVYLVDHALGAEQKPLPLTKTDPVTSAIVLDFQPFTGGVDATDVMDATGRVLQDSNGTSDTIFSNALLGDANAVPQPRVSEGNTDPPQKRGLFALELIAPAIFNLLCLPATAKLNRNSRKQVLSVAQAFCLDKRAFLIMDVPFERKSLADLADPNTGFVNELDADSLRHPNAAVYFPNLELTDPLSNNKPRRVGASGTLAGIYARTDADRGVWKAPAGTDAVLRGGVNLTAKLNDLENGGVNVLGINVLRNFPIFTTISWGARTLVGADQQASEWKYIPVRRTALFIEESLYQGLKWVVFEPNDEPLWAQIRLNVGAFMQNLFRQGAFQGRSPREAYLVKCDRETTTQNDINLGIVNILVGFAPLKPAEFVIIKIQQLAGQIAT